MRPSIWSIWFRGRRLVARLGVTSLSLSTLIRKESDLLCLLNLWSVVYSDDCGPQQNVWSPAKLQINWFDDRYPGGLLPELIPHIQLEVQSCQSSFWDIFYSASLKPPTISSFLGYYDSFLNGLSTWTAPLHNLPSVHTLLSELILIRFILTPSC